MSEWSSAVLSDLVTFQKGKKVATSSELLSGYDRYLGAGSLSGKDDCYASRVSAVIADDRDILMLWDGERSGLVGHKLSGVVSSTVSRLTPTNSIDSEYLYYALSLKFDWIQNRRTGTGVPHVPKDLGRILKLDYPINNQIQKKIAHILHIIDQTIVHTEEFIKKYTQIKAGYMHDLFTRGIGLDGKLRPYREDAPELYKETTGGWIPIEWHSELLDKLAIRGSGHTPSKSHPEYWNGGIKWISLADSYRLDQLYISETDYEISNLGIQNSSAVLHPAGIVVLSRDAGVGKSSITTEPMAVSQHFMCWKCSENLDNHFLYYWLQYNKRHFENIAMGSTILTIGLSYFKRLKITCPIDVIEQISISSKLRSIDDYLFSLKKDLKKKRQQRLGLMHDLLNGKIPVKLETEVVHETTGPHNV